MTFLLFFVLAFVLVILGRAILLPLGLAITGLFRAIVNEILRRLDLQRARLDILDRITGTPPPQPKPITTDELALAQLVRSATKHTATAGMKEKHV